MSTIPAKEAKKIRVEGPDGKMVSLDSLPLVAFKLSCGHLGKEYAVHRGDLLFCAKCARNRKVTRILAQ